MAGNDPISPWWAAARHADRKPFLLARAAITKAVRAFFDEQGFSEVETAILQVSPGNETHLHAPRTELTRADGTRAARYLRTSPEFACKKLLAAGETKIFEFARVFRDRERGDLHLPEFTMLEWYRAERGLRRRHGRQHRDHCPRGAGHRDRAIFVSAARLPIPLPSRS